MSTESERRLVWLGSSYKDLLALPSEVRRFFGFALALAQAGDRHESTKVLKGFGGGTVLEIIENDLHGTYRAVYTVRHLEAVFVLHCFQKKSRQGISTPRDDVDLVIKRLKLADELAKEWRHEASTS